MNKTNLIEKVTEELKELRERKEPSNKENATTAVKCIIKSITEALASGDSVTLIGFGTFKTVHRDARKGRNPQTGKEIDIPARVVAKFGPGKALKEAVNPESE